MTVTRTFTLFLQIILLISLACCEDEHRYEPKQPLADDPVQIAFDRDLITAAKDTPRWIALIEAAGEIDKAYILIADTPVKSIEEDSTQIGEAVNLARDAYRRALSFSFENPDIIKLKCGDNPKNLYGQDRTVSDAVSSAQHGMLISIYYYLDTDGYSRWCGPLYVNLSTIVSSRGKTILTNNRGNINVSPPFSYIVSGDIVSIPNITAFIKR
jgi:hypothetical protein